MTRKQKRLSVIGGGLAFLAVAVGLLLYGLSSSVSYFFMPTELVEAKLEPGQRIRLGGLVEKGSVKRGEGTQISFAVTDQAKSVPVVYSGILPDLFREEQGVITEGQLRPDGVFIADSVLAKHDENYMPKEVADAMKEKGVWQHSGAETPGS